MTDTPTPVPSPPAPAPVNPSPVPPPATPPPVITFPADPVELRNALQAERTSKEAAERALRTANDELGRLKQGQMSESEKAIAAAREEAVKSTMGSVNKRLFAAEVRALVGGRVIDPALFADPGMTMALLGVSEIPLDKTGEIDGEAVKKAVEAFLAAKPYMLNQKPGSAAPPRFPNIDQGVRPNGDQPDFDKMSMEEYKEWADKHDPNTRRRNPQGKFSS